MNQNRLSRLLPACALLAGLLSWPFRAGAETAPPAEAGDFFSFGAVLDAGALARYRGGTDVVVENTNATDGAVHGNTAQNLVTGSNSINTGSFAGASGISTVIQNSGNNVLIQAPVIVNLQVQ